MENQVKKLHQSVSLLISRWKSLPIICLFFIIIFFTSAAFSQTRNVVKGVVNDEQQNPAVGATVALKGSTKVATIADANGKFTLSIPSGSQTLVVSFIGMESQEIAITGTNFVTVTLKSSSIQLAETIIVGYGKQRKESVVGAITQTNAATLEKTGGITTLGAALTGNVPGVITLSGNGAPGGEDPQIYVRGQGTWNAAGPLILVDGIERPMAGLDISSVESISVLKDASATAVFGVKGANGVILVTTKRGSKGKANISIKVNTTMKVPSKLPGEYDSYDALTIRNLAVENELGIKPADWTTYMTPPAIIAKYRNQTTVAQMEQYPNVNWQNESFKSFAMSNNENITVSGGSDFVKYFTSMDYLHEGDVMNVRNNGKGYTPGYGYDQLNFHSNLDINLTPTTTLSANISGFHGNKQTTTSGFEYTMWQSAYSNAPDVMPVQYSDGAWGYYPGATVQVMNSVQLMSNSGILNTKTTRFNTDFTLNQDLKMITPGLTLSGKLALDNTFVSTSQINDQGTIQKWIDPKTGLVQWANATGSNKYDYVVNPWTVTVDNMNNALTARKLYYEARLNYTKKIQKHEITALGLFSRDNSATGSAFPSFREDWVFRTTYDYASKYHIEVNGSYNGSEKFSNAYRFQFFPSAAAGWTLTQENFMKGIKWLSNLKLRGSYGLVGNDNIAGRWLYATQWGYGGATRLGAASNTISPYQWYKEAVIGNPNIHWETVQKADAGLEMGLFKGLIEATADVFQEYRYDIVMSGGQQAIPNYFGGTAPSANLGRTITQGYELEVKLNKRFSNGLRVFINANMTHAKDKILSMDQPKLLPAYQSAEGFQIGQYRSQLLGKYYNTWDQVYGSTQWNANDNQKLPGFYNINDFNGDGVIDSYDNAPNGYPERPQNTYGTTVGLDFKGFSLTIQFYGVNNVTRYVNLGSFNVQTDNVYNVGTYWSKDNPNGAYIPRFNTSIIGTGNFYAYDGSYLRLKNAEIAYTFESKVIQKLGFKSLKVFLNGDNLLLWTKLPDDRESNLGGNGSQGAYPTVRRFNLGVNVVL